MRVLEYPPDPPRKRTPQEIDASWTDEVRCKHCKAKLEIELKDILFDGLISGWGTSIDTVWRSIRCQNCHQRQNYFFDEVASSDREEAQKAIEARDTWNKLYRYRPKDG